MRELWTWIGRGTPTGLWSVCFVLIAGMLIGSLIYLAMTALLDETPRLSALRRRARRDDETRI